MPPLCWHRCGAFHERRRGERPIPDMQAQCIFNLFAQVATCAARSNPRLSMIARQGLAGGRRPLAARIGKPSTLRAKICSPASKTVDQSPPVPKRQLSGAVPRGT